MLKSKALRAKAWNALRGKYWMAFAVVLVLGILVSVGSNLVTFSQNLTEIVAMVDPSEMGETEMLGAAVISGVAAVFGIVGFIISIFIGHAATVGISHYFIKNTDSKPTFTDAFFGFKAGYFRNVGTLFLVNIKTALWMLLLVVPGIIKIFEYAIIPYILADDASVSSKDAFKIARVMMKGNKWRLFKLYFSFIGWGALCALTLGIGTIFLTPYVNAAVAEFYVELKNTQAA